MRTMIAGGTGLIGRALAADLAASGQRVTVLSRRADSAPLFPAGVDLVRWDACSAAGWGHLAGGCDAIVNLAGEPLVGRWTRQKKRRICQSRLDAAAGVLQAIEAAREKPRVLIRRRNLRRNQATGGFA